MTQYLQASELESETFVIYADNISPPPNEYYFFNMNDPAEASGIRIVANHPAVAWDMFMDAGELPTNERNMLQSNYIAQGWGCFSYKNSDELPKDKAGIITL